MSRQAIPGVISPMHVAVNLYSLVAFASVNVPAPSTGKATSRLNWLLRQLKNAPDSIRVDAQFPRRKESTSKLLKEARANPHAMLSPERPPALDVVQTGNVGRKGRGYSHGSFCGDINALLQEFYDTEGLEAPARNPKKADLARSAG